MLLKLLNKIVAVEGCDTTTAASQTTAGFQKTYISTYGNTVNYFKGALGIIGFVCPHIKSYHVLPAPLQSGAGMLINYMANSQFLNGKTSHSLQALVL